MSALIKYAIVMASGIALVGVPLPAWLYDIKIPAENASAPAKPEATVAPVDPSGAAALSEEEQDYRVAQEVGSPQVWRAFLAAHGSGVHAQAARTEMQKLLPAENASAPAKPEATVAPVDPSGAAALGEEEQDYRIAQEVGSAQVWRAFLAAHGSGVHAQAARTEMQKLLPAENASAPAKPETTVAPVDPSGAAALSEEELDYRVAQEVGSAQVWRAFLAAHGSGVHAQAARTEMQKLLPAENASAPAKPETTVAPVDPSGAAALSEEEQDYRVAQEVGSAQVWRAFLAAHGSGVHAQAARTEMQKLLPAENASAPAKPEATVASVDPSGAAALSEEEQDYRVAQEIGSPQVWRAFLAAHGSGVHAQAARTEMQKLLPAENASAPAKPETTVAPVDPSGAAALSEEEQDYRVAQEVGSAQVWRAFLAAHGSGVHAQAARTEMQKLLPAENASAPAKPEATVASVDPSGTAALSEEEQDYRVAQEIGSPQAWRAFLAAHGSGVHAQAARTEMQKLLPAENASAQSSLEAARGASTNGNAAAPPSAETKAATLTPDEICERDGDRLARLRDSRSSEEAARFGNELGCEKLRPQLLGLAESWRGVAPTPALVEPKNGAPLDPKAAGAAPGTAFAGGYEDGAAAYNRGDFITAKRLWLPLAEKGEAKAQTGLALMYFLGQGVKVNLAAALDWCSKAAAQGLPAAQFQLGQIYQHPWDPEVRDLAAALKWYTKAADQGYVDAQDELGGMYEFGLGAPRDYAEAEKWFAKAGDFVSIANMYDGVANEPRLAARWYRKLANRGDKYARFRLGEMYRDGKGVQQDYASALMWFNLAAWSGYPDASIVQDELARKMPPNQVAKAQRLAREWKPTK